MRSAGNNSSADDLESEVKQIRSTVPSEAWDALNSFEAMASAYRSRG